MKYIFLFIIHITISAHILSQSISFNKVEELNHYAELLMSNDPDSAITVFKNLSSQFEQTHNIFYKNCVLYYQALTLYKTNDLHQSESILNDISFDSKIDSQIIFEIKKLQLLGNIEYQQVHYAKAAQYYKKALEWAKQINHNVLRAELNENLGQIYDKTNNADKAIPFYLRSYKLNTLIQKIPSIQMCALSLGRLYLSQNKMDSASYFIAKSKELAFELNDTSMIAESIIEEANLNIQTKNYSRVNELVSQIDKLLLNNSNVNLKVRQYVLEGNYSLLTQDENTAVTKYNNAINYTKKGFTFYIEYYIYSNMADAYFKVGNFPKAFEYLKYITKLKLAYSNKENSNIANEARKNSEIQVRDREIEFLQLQNELKQQKLQKEIKTRALLTIENRLKEHSLQSEKLLTASMIREQALQNDQLNNEKKLNAALLRENELKLINLKDESNIRKYLWCIIAILSILGGFIFLLFKKLKSNHTLIVKQKNDLEYINKEVHHRVKNNLQVISSLLDIQSQSNVDEKVKEVLQESKLRVQSMAFIHQNLYEDEGMNLVDMKNYIQNLIDHLYTTFHKNSERINIETNVSPVLLNMDIVVSVGMIINELVTNSLKYAFLNKKEGTIKVHLSERNHFITFIVEDNGQGLPPQLDVFTIKSFGYKMIRAFVQKLKAQMTIESDAGTKISIVFPIKKESTHDRNKS